MKSAHMKTVVLMTAIGLLGVACAKKKVASTPPPQPAPSVAQAATPATARTTPPPASATRPREDSPRSRYPDAATRKRIDDLLAKIEDAYFDYDRATLRPDAVKALDGNSKELRDILRDYPDYKLAIEGHADERGSAEYNMALGDRRAEAAKDYLVQVGIPSAQLSVISYGKERPVCADHEEACWQRNRRIHIVAQNR